MMNDNSTDKEVNITDTILQFSQGLISKAEYINEMYRKHYYKLFQYSEHLKSSNISRIDILDGQVIMTTRDKGAKFICSEGDHRIAPIEILNFADYEKENGVIIDFLLKDNDVFFDVGANMGWYSINMAISHPKLEIYCFDPIPNTYDFLIKNLQLNGLSQIHAHNFAFSDYVGELELFYYKEGSGNASLANLSERADVEKIKCRTETIDEFTLREEIGIDFLKCDVEGAELKVFQGGLATITRDKPIVFSEILRKWSRKLGYDPNEIFSFFYDLQYRAFTAIDRDSSRLNSKVQELGSTRKSNKLEEVVKKKGGRSGLLQGFYTMDDSTTHTNFFFLHKDKHKDLINRYCIG